MRFAPPIALATLALAALLLTACGPRYAVRGVAYDLAPVEAGYADEWAAAEPVEAAEACRYWDARQQEAGRAHTRTARKVGDFRQLRLWTQANRIARCTDAGASDQTPRTLPGAAADEDAPPVVAPLATPEAEDAPPAPAESAPADEDAPPPQ